MTESRALYLEVDEEITSAIDKLARVKADEVALVVPKRSTLLASAVNLKLLKKAASEHHKRLVLVTTDKTARYMASRVGLMVAASVTAEPELVEEPVRQAEAVETVIEEAAEPEPHQDFDRAVKPVEGASAVAAAAAEAEAATKPPATAKTVSKPTSPHLPSKLKIPDFSKLQKRVVWGVGALAIVIILVILGWLLPTATVTLLAKGTPINANFSLIADPHLQQSNPATAKLAADLQTTTKDLSGNFTATGKKDASTKAAGSTSMKNCQDTQSHTLAAGTKIFSGNLVFLLNSDTTLPAANFSYNPTTHNFDCSPGTATLAITASSNGEAYNLSGATFTVAGFDGSVVNGTGTTTGGLTKQLTIVSQDDIDLAKKNLADDAGDPAKKELQAKVPSGKKSLDDTFQSTVVSSSSSVQVGQEAPGGSVSVKVTYTLLDVSNADLAAALDANLKTDIGPQNQLYDDGFGQIVLSGVKLNADGSANLSLATTAYAGAKLDTQKIAGQLTGKKVTEAADLASGQPSISSANIDVWPGWSTTMPHLSSHIKIKIQVVPQG